MIRCSNAFWRCVATNLAQSAGLIQLYSTRFVWLPMDTRLLYLIAVVVAAYSGWYYWQSGQQVQIDSDLTQGIAYSARDIKLVQTDKQGQLQATTRAADLRHFGTTDRTELDQVESIWYQAGQQRATLTAAHAELSEQNQKILLNGGVQIRHINPTNQQETRFNTSQLVGYPKTRQIETDLPVQVISSQGTISSQGLRANLSEGDYQLQRIRIEYAPASRP